MSNIPVPLEGFGGGNAPLNFKVAGGTAEPANPRENMTWIHTDVPITRHYFSATQPENMAEGEVWISTGRSSRVAFNALKKNSIMVYPMKAKQMVSGSLVERTAKTYQDGQWREWTTYLFTNGDECADITGGWQSAMVSDSCTLTKEITDAGVLRMTAAAGGNHRKGYFYTEKEIDLSGADSVRFNITEFYATNDGNAKSIYISPRNALGSPVAEAVISGIGEMSLDVTGLDGAYSVVFCLGGTTDGNYTTVAVDGIWLD